MVFLQHAKGDGGVAVLAGALQLHVLHMDVVQGDGHRLLQVADA